MLFKVVMKSATGDARVIITNMAEEYHVTRAGSKYECGILLLYAIIKHSIMDVVMDPITIRARLSNSATKFKEFQCDAPTFNTWVREQLALLRKAGEKSEESKSPNLTGVLSFQRSGLQILPRSSRGQSQERPLHYSISNNAGS